MMVILTIEVTEDEHKVLEMLVRKSVYFMESIEYELDGALAPKIVEQLQAKGLVDVRLIDKNTGSVRLNYASAFAMKWEPKPLAAAGNDERPSVDEVSK